MVRPSNALNGAVVLGFLLSVVAMLTHDAEVMVLAVPFLVYAAWGWASHTSEDLAAASRRGQIRLTEDVTASVTPAIPTRLPLVVTDWPSTTIGWVDPPRGATIGVAEPEPIAVTAARWGTYQLGPALVLQADALAAWTHQQQARPIQAKVEPRTQALEGESGVRNPRGVNGAHTSSRPGEGSNLAEIREYRPGDRLRRVNWRVTARTGELHVSQTLTERDTSVYIVLDSLQEVAGHEATPVTSLDTGIRAGMAIMRHYLALGDRVALVDLGGSFPALPLGTGTAQARRALASFAGIDREALRRPTLRRVQSVPDGSLVFLLSPVLVRASVSEAARLQALGAQVIVVDCLPDSRTPELRLQRLAREPALDRLGQLGIPVVAWTGPSSLGGVLTALQNTQGMARRSR